LASLTAVWKPHVVLVKRREEVVGIFYARERMLGNYATGLFHLDTTLGSMPVAEHCSRDQVFLAALKALLEQVRVRALRLIIPPDGVEEHAARVFFSSLQFEVLSTVVERQHRVVKLRSSYEDFLDSLGKRTRRNFRYYRRRFEADGHRFVNGLSLSEFMEATFLLLQRNVIGVNSVDLQCASKMIGETQQPLLVGLRHGNGQWLSTLGGWYDHHRVVVIAQVNNDQEYPQYSLSSVLRAYLCEKLIEQGITEVVFWGGVVGPLHQYSELVPGICLYVDEARFGWRALRKTVQVFRWALPKRMAAMAQWIVPVRSETVSHT
jgi:hypothetical protein